MRLTGRMHFGDNLASNIDRRFDGCDITEGKD